MQYSVFFICGKRPLPGTLIVQKYRAPVKAAEGSGLQARRAALRGRRQKNCKFFRKKLPAFQMVRINMCRAENAGHTR